jgi:hypothetical protein
MICTRSSWRKMQIGQTPPRIWVVCWLSPNFSTYIMYSTSLSRPLPPLEDFQGFLARVSEKVRFSPILHPHLVEYLFIQPFSLSQRFINYRVDTALLCVLFCVFLYLFIQKLFRVENRRWKRQSSGSFFQILPHYTPIYLFIQKLFRVEKYHLVCM